MFASQTSKLTRGRAPMRWCGVDNSDTLNGLRLRQLYGVGWVGAGALPDTALSDPRKVWAW